MTTTTRFALGRILATPGAINAMREAGESPIRLLRRHANGDFGDLHGDDARANELAIRRGMRVLSAYVLSTDERVWIITEADRSAHNHLAAGGILNGPAADPDPLERNRHRDDRSGHPPR